MLVKAARALSSGTGAVIHLLHVIETIHDAPFDELEDFYSRLEAAAETQLDTLERRFSEESLECTTELRFGNRTNEILRVAEEQNVALILLHSHPVDPSQPARSLGTISYQVSILSRCPVLLLK